MHAWDENAQGAGCWRLATGVVPATAQVEPSEVDLTLNPGETSGVILKQVTTPAIPPVVDICLLEDEAGSFGDDIANLQNEATIAAIYNTITASSPGANFAVAGFRDYPVAPHGGPGDWVYHRLSGMSPLFADWQAGVLGLTAGGGADIPEAQYDAIVAAVGPGVWPDPSEGP